MRVRRAPVDDELMIDGELVVLVDDQVLVLSEVASQALHGLVTTVWTSLETLTQQLASSVGLPEDGPRAVSSLVSALQEAGLVVVDH